MKVAAQPHSQLLRTVRRHRRLLVACPAARLAAAQRAGQVPARQAGSGVHRLRRHGSSDGEQLSGLIAGATAQAGVRAVVQAGWAGLSAQSGTEVLAVGDLPHEWMFPRMAAVVHHAGAGTTGAGLRAGIPAVAIPVAADQPFWAGRLHRLGVSPPPIPFATLNAEVLANAITDAVNRPDYRQRAARIASLIAAEDGASKVLAQVRRLAG